MKNIVLIGFRASGKTTFGAALAKKLQVPFADIDHEIEFVLGESIMDFVDKYGWQVFREIEQRVTHDFCRNFCGVIATGGGTIENSKNLQNLKKNGVFVFLNPKFSDVKKFLLKDTTRPRINTDIPHAQEIDQMWAQRKDIYGATADIEVSPDIYGDVSEQAELIANAIPKDVVRIAPAPKRVAVFSSGKSNFLQQISEAQNKGRIPHISFVLIVDRGAEAGSCLDHTKALGVKQVEVFSPDEHSSTEDAERHLINVIRQAQPDLILSEWEESFSPLYTDHFGDVTYSAYPALLPKFHDISRESLQEHVLDEGERYTGVTICRTTSPDKVDGDIVLQRKILIDEEDTPLSLTEKIEKQGILGFCEFLERK